MLSICTNDKRGSFRVAANGSQLVAVAEIKRQKN